MNEVKKEISGYPVDRYKCKKDSSVDNLNSKFRNIEEKKQRVLNKKRQHFLELVLPIKKWKIRLSLSGAEIIVMARVLCRSLSLDSALQHQHLAIYGCKEEKDFAKDVLHKLLLSFRRSSSHRKDLETHPDYREQKWHGNHSIILYDIQEAFDTSYESVDAQILKCDYIYEMIGADAYKKRAMKIIEEIKRR